MTTMDSDSESQDSDDGRRFRFEATRKDNVQPEPKVSDKQSKSRSKNKPGYDDDEYKDRKEKSRHESGRRERRLSKERVTESRDVKHTTKYSKHSDESRSSRREDSKDYRSSRDVSLDSKHSPLSSKRKTRDTKRHRHRDRSEHRKHRSQERSHNRNEEDRTTVNDKHRNKSHEKYKRHSRDRSRDRGYQSHKARSSEQSRFQPDSERQNSYKRTSVKTDEDPQEYSSPRNAEHGRNDDELSTKRDISVESDGCKELDLSEFDVLSETDENLSDASDTKSKGTYSRHHKTKTKKNRSNDECENVAKKQAIENEQSEGSPKVNARTNDLLHGSGNNNAGAVSDSAIGVASPISTEITEDYTNDAGERCQSREEDSNSLEKASSCLVNHDSPKATEHEEDDFAYGPLLPPQSKADSPSNAKSAKTLAFIGPCLPDTDVTMRSEDDEITCNHQNDSMEDDSAEDSNLFGPALPPHLLGQKSTEEQEKKKIIGPTLPAVTKSSDNDEIESPESENEDAIGPLPANHPALKSNYVHRQLEQRALQIKTEQRNESDSVLNEREEWMVELPPAQISNLGLAPRKFRARAGPDMSDRSCWTDTPAKKAEKQKQKEEGKYSDFKATNKEVSNESCESSESRKHEKTLLEIHQTKLRKKKKKEEKKAKLSGQAVRRPFDRDVDLQINQFDQVQKNAIINKAQYLDERFSRGKI